MLLLSQSLLVIRRTGGNLWRIRGRTIGTSSDRVAVRAVLRVGLDSWKNSTVGEAAIANVYTDQQDTAYGLDG